MARREPLAQPRFPAADWEQMSLEVRPQVWPCWFTFIQLCWCVALWTDHILVFASQHREDPLLSTINREIISCCKQTPASTACVCTWLFWVEFVGFFFPFSFRFLGWNTILGLLPLSPWSLSTFPQSTSTSLILVHGFAAPVARQQMTISSWKTKRASSKL